MIAPSACAGTLRSERFPAQVRWQYCGRSSAVGVALPAMPTALPSTAMPSSPAMDCFDDFGNKVQPSLISAEPHCSRAPLQPNLIAAEPEHVWPTLAATGDLRSELCLVHPTYSGACIILRGSCRRHWCWESQRAVDYGRRCHGIYGGSKHGSCEGDCRCYRSC